MSGVKRQFNVDPCLKKIYLFKRREQKTIVNIFLQRRRPLVFLCSRREPDIFAITSMRFARATRLFVRVSLKNTETNGTEITDREREITETKEETEEHAGRWLSELHTTRAATDIVTSFIVKYGKWTAYLSTRIMFRLSFHKTKQKNHLRNEMRKFGEPLRLGICFENLIYTRRQWFDS